MIAGKAPADADNATPGRPTYRSQLLCSRQRYPRGLRGEEIPLEGRITAVADVFDALCSKRPYKPAFPLDKCFGTIEEETGKHFDPTVVRAFLARKDAVIAVYNEFRDL